MAQYWEDWSGSTVGSAPTGWTARWNTEGVTRTVETEAATEAPAGRRLRVVTTTQARRGFSWDAIDSDAARNTCEIAVLVKVVTPAIDAFGFGAMGRGSGAAASETAVVGGICRATSLKDRILYYQNGTSTQDTANGVTGMANGNWVWVRLKLDGTTATLRFSTAADPNTILLTDTFTIASDWGAGWVGLFDFASGLTWDIAAIGVGTGASDAPLTDPGAGDTTAPTLSSPSGAATGSTTASGSVTTNEANGTLYWLASTSATATAAAVKAGSSQAVSATGSQSVTVSGLTASTAYYLHYLHRDAAGNDSAVATSAQFTTAAAGDTTAPTLSAAGTSNVTSTTASGSVTTDEGNGTLYWLVNTSASATATAVKAGSSQAVPATGAQSVSISGLTASTTYYVHFLHRDASGNDSTVLTSASFTTSAPTVVKGAVVMLYSDSTAQASLTGITARWWDSPTAAGAPLAKTDTASTDATGKLVLNIDSATSLAVGGAGYLSLYKAGADVQSDLHFASRITVSDIG